MLNTKRKLCKTIISYGMYNSIIMTTHINKNLIDSYNKPESILRNFAYYPNKRQNTNIKLLIDKKININ